MLSRSLVRTAEPTTSFRSSTCEIPILSFFKLGRRTSSVLRLLTSKNTSIPYTMTNTFLLWQGTGIAETSSSSSARTSYTIKSEIPSVTTSDTVHKTVPFYTSFFSVRTTGVSRSRRTFLTSLAGTSSNKTFLTTTLAW